MTKKELEVQVKEIKQKWNIREKEYIDTVSLLRKAATTRERNIKEALIDVLENTCSESHEHVRDFCEYLDVEFPVKQVQIKVEVPYGSEICSVTDEDSEELEWTDL